MGIIFTRETQPEREIVIGAILFAMGMQNGLVSTISGGTDQIIALTGLFTDLGSDTCRLDAPQIRVTEAIKHKVYM
jgi:uncharacterized membrane protein YoaK (UPF0700 family)